MTDIQTIISYCKARGFIFQNSEIYGGLNGFFDYGPLGVQLKKNIYNSYVNYFVLPRENIIEQSGSIVSNPKVWEASGHTKNFSDPVAITKSGFRCRADHLIEDNEKGIDVDGLTCEELFNIIKERNISYNSEEIVKVENANLMFSSQILNGPICYLRPETCQNIFVNAKYLAEISRLQLPFGIVQYGKVFRNEISPRNFIFRCREFEQLEMEYFYNPAVKYDVDEKYLELQIECLLANGDIVSDLSSMMNKTEGRVNGYHLMWIAEMVMWLTQVIGLKIENLRLREHCVNELSHYSSATFDVEYRYPFGNETIGQYKELCGIANRGCYDVKQHALGSKKNLKFKCLQTKEKLYPHVIEPSVGMERLFLAVICDAYDSQKTEKKDKKGQETTYTVLHISEKLSPTEYAIFPLPSKKFTKELFYKKSREIQNHLISGGKRVIYDESGSIGRRYARQDEIGTKWCITVDDITLEDETVTVRDRDTKHQYRILFSKL